MVTGGLTGGIASGKSTVSMEFKKLGAVIIDADKIARALIQPHSSLWKKVIEHFGREIQKEDLTIDRLKLGQEVFADEAKREALDRMAHPEIKREIDRRRSEIRKEHPEAVVLIDAALLIETGTFREMDRIIVVAASKRNQIRRLVDRDGLNIEEARRRIRAQMPLTEKLRYADYVINTDGSLEEIRKQVRRVHGKLMAIRAKGGVSSLWSHAPTRND
ncbi:MAG: dephospho-CoA kinase [Deltaproteobacteria bacterium]|nr:dephospho-CoA kinase [Deltaproteobacteria bacterium]